MKTADRFDTAIEEKLKKKMIQEILKETGKREFISFISNLTECHLSESSLLDTFSQVESEVKELESSVMEAIMQTTITDPGELSLVFKSTWL